MTTHTEMSLAERFYQSFSQHYALNDNGHRKEHFEQVEKLGKEMNADLDLGIDERLITAVAWCHDLFAWSRVNHHVLASTWVRSTDHPVMSEFTVAERDLIGDACATHRASFKGSFPSTLAELMSSADRGYCGDIRDAVMRAFSYSIDTMGMGREEGMLRAVKHQSEKFGRHGYARFPNIYRTYFEDIIEERYSVIEKMQSMTYLEICEFIGLNSELNHVRR